MCRRSLTRQVERRAANLRLRVLRADRYRLLGTLCRDAETCRIHRARRYNADAVALRRAAELATDIAARLSPRAGDAAVGFLRAADEIDAVAFAGAADGQLQIAAALDVVSRAAVDALVCAVREIER